MKTKIIAFGLLVMALSQSCQSNDDLSGKEEKVILNSDANSLNARMDHSSSGVINLVGSNLTSRNAATSETDKFPMSLVAEVNPPVYEGKTLTATHVDVKDKYVYVSYNTVGETYLGGLDVIDISEPNNPKLVVQAILPNTDISTVIYDNGNLYFSGATSVDANANLTTPAFVAKMPLQNGLLTTDYSNIPLLSYVGTGVAVATNDYFAVSGNNGVLAKIDKTTNSIKVTIPIADLRALGYINNKVVVLSGKEGVKVYNADSMSLVSSFAATTDVAEAKRTIDFQGDNILVAQGYSGLLVYSATGSLLQTLSLPTAIAGVSPSDVVTNAVSVNGDYAYAANGAAGIAVYQKQTSNLVSLGSISLGGSANYVKSVGDYIFVATGSGGLKIVKKVTVPTIDCSNFQTYNGGQWLNVNSGETLNYQGSASIQGINVNQNLTFCGSLSIKQGVNINSGGVFTMKGSMAQGNYNSNSSNFNFNINGTFKVEGSVVLYGNLILNSGATIEFVGSGSSITIYGKVTKNSGVTIKGNYTDTFNSLK
ncbi:hypothetical protein [Flavobacterium frigoris]|uniref:LVIVD repeat-containing protein n=1 Tax=Flavobacterium frigoris (strain PS1) TaxID=1086011 RepID=H7FR68_FLAFP|nr:hypothetical protein [Flavobacterium frigoris]EIA08851.1 hypothetical protein HJ01_01617 [Flavobacterium frigoris PS1]